MSASDAPAGDIKHPAQAARKVAGEAFTAAKCPATQWRGEDGVKLASQ